MNNPSTLVGSVYISAKSRPAVSSPRPSPHLPTEFTKILTIRTIRAFPHIISYPLITNMDEVSDYHEDQNHPQKKRRKYIAKAWYIPFDMVSKMAEMLTQCQHSNECKRRKIKCNGQTPCQRCGRQRIDCVYADNPRSLGDTLSVSPFSSEIVSAECEAE